MSDISIYQSIYDLIVNIIYGGVLPASGESVCTLVATCASVLLFAIPFIFVFKLIKLILR